MSSNQLFVIYNIHTLKLAKTRAGQTMFRRLGTARTIRSKQKLSMDEWKVATVSEWEQADYEIEVKSLMTGGLCKIRKSQRGNPASDPSMEGHWTA